MQTASGRARKPVRRLVGAGGMGPTPQASSCPGYKGRACVHLRFHTSRHHYTAVYGGGKGFSGGPPMGGAPVVA